MASENFSAWSVVILPGIGGSFGSIKASISVGPGWAKASRKTASASLASVRVKPFAPQARAKAAKSIGCNATPKCGLPSRTICSHLIMPSVLFLKTTTLIGRSYFTSVAISAINIEKPPSPARQTTCRPGFASAAPMAYGKPLAIVASVPEAENCISPRISM